MNNKYLWPDGSLNVNPYKRTVPAPKGLPKLIVKLRYLWQIYKQINVDVTYEGHKIVSVRPWVLFKKIGNGKLPKQQ